MAEIVALAAEHINSEIKERKKSAKMKQKVNLLSSELKTVSDLMIDAEKTELSKSLDFQDWVKEMVKIAFEAEDEVDNLPSKFIFSPLFKASSSSSEKLQGLIARTRDVKKKLDDTGGMSRERGSPAPQEDLSAYGQLPNYLKLCFLYMGLFPEGPLISAGTLIRMWIAEGFINDLCHGEETVEVAGRRCLQELIDHDMVQIQQKKFSGKVKSIQIRGKARDLALSKATELGFLTVAPQADAETSRRVAILLSPSSQSDNLPANNSHLRSLSLFEVLKQSSARADPTPERHTSKLTQKCSELDNVFKTYKLLRLLDIFGIKTTNGTLPKDLGNLTHLKYLRIRSTNIRQLPVSIGNLRNLLTLDYRDVTGVPHNTRIQVPNVLCKLKKLRHLYLPIEMSGAVEALKLDTLKYLITLWGVVGGNWMLKEMGKLSTTLSKLFIHQISTMDQIKAVLGCRALAENENLHALALGWCTFEFNIIHDLCVHENLKQLKLIGKASDKSDNGELELPSNLEKLELHNTQLERPVTLDLLGRLTSLKVLKLCNDSYVGSEWSCPEQIFPILEELKLANLSKLEKWVLGKGAMPCLKKLSIFACSNLQRLPERLKLIQGLERLDIQHMPGDFLGKLGKEGEDYHIIMGIPNKNLRHRY